MWDSFCIPEHKAKTPYDHELNQASLSVTRSHLRITDGDHCVGRLEYSALRSRVIPADEIELVLRGGTAAQLKGAGAISEQPWIQPASTI